jgi:hypothetical protein
MIETQGMTRQAHGEMRRGKLSGSKAADLMSGSYVVWNRLLKELRAPPPFYGVGPNTPAPLRWGKEHEDRALAIWWDRHALLDVLNPVCMAYHDPANALWSKYVVVSPDRVAYDPRARQVVAGIELKCPFTEGKMAKWSLAKACPAEHFDQCAFGRLVTNLPLWLFVAYDPRMAEGNEFFEVQVAVPDSYLAEMYEKGTRFLQMLESGGEFQPTTRKASKLKEMFQ